MADPHLSTENDVDPAFIQDRRQFWDSFTGATKFAIGAIVVLLIGMWLFLA